MLHPTPWYSEPMAPNHANAFNPPFISGLLEWVLVLVALSALTQLSLARWNAPKLYANHWYSLSNVGAVQVTRLALVAIQAVLTFAIACVSTSSAALLWVSLTLALVLGVLPLHAVETTAVLHQSATLLVFWLCLPVFLATGAAQTTFNPEFSVVGRPSAVGTALLWLAAINAAVVFVFELFSTLWSVLRKLRLYYEDLDPSSLVLANLFDLFTFLWLTPLISQTYVDGKVDGENLPPTPVLAGLLATNKRMFSKWDAEIAVRPTTPLLTLVLFKCYFTDLVLVSFTQLLESLSMFVQPQMLRMTIQFFETYTSSADPPSLLVAVVLAVGVLLAATAELVVFNISYGYLYELGLKCKTGLMLLIYRKLLRLLAASRNTSGNADVKNMLGVDVNNMQQLMQNVHILISAPLKLFLCLGLLYALVGWLVLAGIVVLAVMIPLNTLLLRRMERVYETQMKLKDKRVNAINELLTAIKSIKLYAWETPMKERINHIRNDEELANTRQMGLLDSCSMFLWDCVPFFVASATLAYFVLVQKQRLTPEIAFPALALFKLLEDPIYEVPGLISTLIEARVSIKRISDFMRSSEIELQVDRAVAVPAKIGDTVVEVRNGTFVWDPKTPQKTALTDINLTAKKGKLTCVVGRVGSGKLTLLQVLLGELPKSPEAVDLYVAVRGVIAYCLQNAWILNGTIKENIVFGHRFDPAFYDKVVSACALGPDMKVFADGDETQVGEKGISLSGGQKARIAIARAVYARADVYILDDVLLAVDAHVAKHLVDNVLGPKGLLATKTRVLATNSIPVLRYAESIVMLADGKVSETALYAEAMNKKQAIYELVKEHGVGADETDDVVEEVDESADVVQAAFKVGSPSSVHTLEPAVFDPNTEDALMAMEAPVGRASEVVSLRRASVATLRRNKASKEDNRKTAELDENLTRGSITLGIYWTYIKAGGVATFAWLSLATVCRPVLLQASNYWLKNWSEGSGDADDAMTNVTVYFVLGMTGGVMGLVLALVLWYYFSYSVLKHFHEQMVEGVIRLPMLFFETTPLGRIVNRFTQDTQQMDNFLPRIVDMIMHASIEAVVVVLTISFLVPSFLLVVAVLFVCFWYYQMYYTAVLREFKRIASTSVLPVFAHVQELINGMDTIRAYGQETRFDYLHRMNVDFMLAVNYYLMLGGRWIAFRLKALSAVALFITTMICIGLLTTSNPISSGMIGFLLTMLLTVTLTFNWIVRMMVELETRFVLMQRIMEYGSLKSEAASVVEDHRPAANWPARGEIKFNNYSTKYRANLDPVLKGISLDIQPREKIGIVGRTGAGKLSLTLALFRIIEATGGHINVDGMDTDSIGLFDLRSNLNIIPQDLQVLEGTIRLNLDPFDRHLDDKLWRVLRLAHLEEHVKSMGKSSESDENTEGAENTESTATTPAPASPELPKDDGDENTPLLASGSDTEDDEPATGLFAKVKEGGANMSVGQRQLMCLARALLNELTVLVLDEATLLVDVQTDKVIQETIRLEFSDKTILTIAHRLDTVMDSDRILVLERGEVKEFALPKELLADPTSEFYLLCQQGGYLKNA